MTRPLAVLDTSAIVLILSRKLDDTPEEQEADRRREAVRQRLHDMQASHRFGIPAVVVAELGRDGDAEPVLGALVGAIGRIRILPLTRTAALVAAKMRREALSKRALGAERGAVTYDALICGTAIAVDADCIVCENPRDFKKHLAAVGSSLEVIVPTEPPKHGQLHMMQAKPQTKK